MIRFLLLLRGLVLACIALAMCDREACAGWIDAEEYCNAEWMESPDELLPVDLPSISDPSSDPRDSTPSRFASLTELLLGLAESPSSQPAQQQSTSSGQLSSTSLSPPALGAEVMTEPPSLCMAVSPHEEVAPPRPPVDELFRPPRGVSPRAFAVRITQ